MKVIVTGGTGLVGRRIVRLLSESHDVRNLDLREPENHAGVHVRCDILDAPAVYRTLEGADAVVHAAAIPGPSFGMAEDIYMVNIKGTETVANAARALGISRFVHISSDAVLGIVFSRGKAKPRYLPIDEDHPLQASEPYGRSKLLAEEALADMASDGLTVVSLRPPWVWVQEEYGKTRRLTFTPDEWPEGLWAYIHGDDLARAVKLALEREVPPGFHAVYVAARDNGTTSRTRTLIERYYPNVPVRPGITDFGSLISSARAAALLGFEAEMTWRGFLS